MQTDEAVVDLPAMRSHARWLTRPASVAAVIAVLLVGVLYADAVSLPLFSDDLVQIPWLETMSWRDLWTTPSPYGYYRPLWYTIWRGWGGLVGGLHPPGLHLLNLIAHAGATWLTGMMAARWLPAEASGGKRAAAAGLAAIFFVVFPFSRQAVAWPGAVYNPIVSGLAAAAVLAYDAGRSQRSRWLMGMALIIAAVAPFIYESGILVGPLLLVVELMGWWRERWATQTRAPLALAGLFVITLGLWRAMRGEGVTAFGLKMADLGHNTGYLAQGLIYPLAPGAQQLVGWGGLDPALAVWLVALPAMGVLLWAGARKGLDLLLLGAAWFALFALPPLVSMEADWFALAPRFLYMTAGGASLVWAAALVPNVAGERGPAWQITTVAVVALLLVPAGHFVRQGIRLYHMAGESIWDAAAAVTKGQQMLLVNLPRRITPERRLYPLGFEGVTPLPMRVSAEELAYVHTGVRAGAEAVALGVVATDEPNGYTYELFGRPVGWQEASEAMREADSVYLTQYETRRIHLVEAGGVGAPAVDAGVQAAFGEHLELLDASAVCDEGGIVRLTTWWVIGSDVTVDLSVYAHLLESDGTMAAQADGRPLLGMLPFWLWDRHEVVRDVRHFAPVESGTYGVQFGLWEPATGEHWRAEGYPEGAVVLSADCP